MRKKLPMGKAEATDPALHMEMETLRQEREAQFQFEEVQAGREQDIAVAYEEAGKIKALTFCEKVATVATYVRLQHIKDNELYKPFGTWQKYCDYIGLKRRTVDEELQKLAELGESFLATCRQFNLSHRDIKTICLIKKEGELISLSDDGKTITIEGQILPIDEEHADELGAAVDSLLEKQKTLNTRVEKLEKNLKSAVDEETKGFKSEKKALLERIQSLEQFEPKEADREWAVKQMANITKAANSLQLAISGFIIDPRLKDDRHLQALVNQNLQEAEMALHDVRQRLDDVIDMFND